MERAKFGFKNIPKSQERGNSGQSKPRQLPEVEITQQATIALDVYRELYEKRYGSKPIFPSLNAATTSMKDILRKVQPEGLPRVLAIVKQYLRMDGYFKERRHVLDVLLRNIQEVGAATRPEVPPNKQGVELAIDSRCPMCNSWFELRCNSNDIEKKVLMTLCRKCVETAIIE